MNNPGHSSSPSVWTADPVSIALYSFFFRSGPEDRHLSDAVRALTADVSKDQVAELSILIERELQTPTRQVHLTLPGAQRSEEECRAFLVAVVREIRGTLA